MATSSPAPNRAASDIRSITVAVALPVPKTAKVIVSGTNGPTRWANVFHVGYSTDFLDAGEVQALADQFYTAYANAVKPVMASGSSILQATAQDISTNTGPIKDHIATTGGTNVAGTGPAQIAACITWHVATHYRGGHPRTYLPAVPYTATSDGRSWSSSYQALLNTAASGLFTAINAINVGAAGVVTLVAVHRVRNKVALAPPETEPIISVEVDSRIDTQRRRVGPDVP